MRVHVTFVGRTDYEEITWPAGWPIPPEGAEVRIRAGQDQINYVRSVTWYPEGSEGARTLEPFVYIVLAPERSRQK